MATPAESETVGLFGGSFNPPHVGHVLAVSYALAAGEFDRIIVVPVYAHAFEKALAPFEVRLHLCKLAFSFLKDVEVSSVESALGAPSLTLRTLQALQGDHPGWRMRLVIGADVLQEVHKWHAFDEIERIAPPFVLGRSGVAAASAPRPLLPEVSSTEIRRLVAMSDDADATAELETLLPRSVLRFVRRTGLYR